MNAGKSTTLLQSAHNYHEKGMRTILFCPWLDTRKDSNEEKKSPEGETNTLRERNQNNLNGTVKDSNIDNDNCSTTKMSTTCSSLNVQNFNTSEDACSSNLNVFNTSKTSEDTITKFSNTAQNSAVIHSRLGLSRRAVVFTPDFDFQSYIATESNKDSSKPPLRCLLIDEAHFLSKAQVAQLVLLTKSKSNLAVLCYGLRTDYLGEPFPGSQYLLAWAEELMEIKTICHCGSKATMNIRYQGGVACKLADKGGEGDKGQICIGGNESYDSACMRHFDGEVAAIRGYARGCEGGGKSLSNNGGRDSEEL